MPVRKYAKVAIKNPKPLGICARSDMTFNLEDLEEQMEWRGNRKVGNGLLIGKPFIDIPNAQEKTPSIKSDPKSVLNARVPDYYIDPNTNSGKSQTEIEDSLKDFNWGA